MISHAAGLAVNRVALENKCTYHHVQSTESALDSYTFLFDTSSLVERDKSYRELLLTEITKAGLYWATVPDLPLG